MEQGGLGRAVGGCCHSLQASMYDVDESWRRCFGGRAVGPHVLVRATGTGGIAALVVAGPVRLGAVVLAIYSDELALSSADDVEDNGKGTGTTTTARCDARRGGQ
jgi:hypothetical protein